jgi:hypothetical protein
MSGKPGKPKAAAGHQSKGAYQKSDNAEIMLVVQGPDNKFYIAGNAQLVPDEYANMIRTYEDKKGDGVFQSPRSFFVVVPRDSNLVKFIGGVLPPKPPKFYD